MALQVVDIAPRKHFVVAFRLSLLLSLICSKSSVDYMDNFSCGCGCVVGVGADVGVGVG
jgi:hypothetical protein